MQTARGRKKNPNPKYGCLNGCGLFVTSMGSLGGFTGWGWPGDLWGWSLGQLAQQAQDQEEPW